MIEVRPMQLGKIRVNPNRPGILEGLVSNRSEVEHWEIIDRFRRPNQPGAVITKGKYAKLRLRTEKEVLEDALSILWSKG